MHQCPREDITFHVTQHSRGLMPLLDLNFTELSPSHFKWQQRFKYLVKEALFFFK